MFDFVIGLGQGGGRIAYEFGKGFDVPTTFMNLAGVDFTHIETDRRNVLVMEEGGTGRNPEFGERMVRERIDELYAFLDRPSFESSKYVLVCVGGGGGAGTGFMFPLIDTLIHRKKEVFLVYTLPESREGVPTKPNALSALDRIIQRYVQTEKLSLLLIDNEYCLKRYGNGEGFDYWGAVNRGVVASLKRFWLLTEIDRFSAFIDVASGYKALDKNDIRRILFSRSGYTDLRQMVFSQPSEQPISKMLRDASLVFGSLDMSTAKRYVVSVGIPDSWKKISGILDFVEYVLAGISKATRHTPDVLRCSYFNKKLSSMQVHVMASGMARGKGIDRMITSAERDRERLNSREGIERLKIENIG